ncbi:hypothetical protein LMG23992_02240 [Cupriavidus laharis]|uniref:G domain-containing protein n=1 Tax=Cupriavidus laharis TaxID=151654 RepID=A0ABN7YJE8_9BURK|nr:hypothetical protein [Cupriavidus laharis]CAG9172461.1 hypothetical protein LMG23992_02240 [Cupriavidus laharis]
MSLAEYWRGLHDNRLAWAHEAYRQFVDTLDESVRECFANTDGEASVALFGRTQVGKTSLLLILIGVHSDWLDHAGKLLRGGRGAGQSATATAMQYHRASGERWHIRFDDRDIDVPDTGLESELADIREQVEAGRWRGTDPIQIGIPSQYFEPASSDDVQAQGDALARIAPRIGVRILDLPGDSPRNENERKHVHDVAQRYLPVADLILMVGKLDDLSFLNPEAMRLPGIRDWRYVPDRFRIVTTYSYSLQSEREWAKRQGTPDVNAIRAHLHEQIQTHGIELDARAGKPELLYAVDIGKSWRALKSSDPETFERIQQANAAMMAALIQDVGTSATEHGRLRLAAQSHIYAARAKKAELARMEQAKADQKARRDSIEGDCTKLQVAIASLEKRIEDDQQACFEVERLDRIPGDFHGALKWPGESLETLDNLPSRASALQEYIAKCCNTLVEWAIEDVPGMVDDLASPLSVVDPLSTPVERRQLRNVVEYCFSDLNARLAGYFWDRYLPALFDQFATDKAALRQAMTVAREAAVRHSAYVWQRELRVARDQREGLLQQKYRDRQAKKTALDELEAGRKKVSARIAELESDIAIQGERTSEERKLGERFESELRDACAREVKLRRERAKNAATAPRRLLELLAAEGVARELHKLLVRH